MKRREFIGLLGGAAAAWPLAARAQQPAMPVIGVLGSETFDAYAQRLVSFRQGLSETGYVEGRNVGIEYRWADSQNDRLPALAADLVRRQVAVIAAIGGTPSIPAAKAATATIPIVFQTGADPVEVGFVASLSRPGGNLTGVATLNVEVGPKQLELLHELIPSATSIAALVNPHNPILAENTLRGLESAARTLGLQLDVLHAGSEAEVGKAFEAAVQRQAGGLVIGTEPLFNGRSEQLAALALHYALPTIFQFREFTAAGGLISYGPNLYDIFRQLGIYTGRILKGEKPADLPVTQSTRFELTINLKTAKALGLSVPPTLLAIADEVIE